MRHFFSPVLPALIPLHFPSSPFTVQRKGVLARIYTTTMTTAQQPDFEHRRPLSPQVRVEPLEQRGQELIQCYKSKAVSDTSRPTVPMHDPPRAIPPPTTYRFPPPDTTSQLRYASFAATTTLAFSLAGARPTFPVHPPLMNATGKSSAQGPAFVSTVPNKPNGEFNTLLLHHSVADGGVIHLGACVHIVRSTH